LTKKNTSNSRPASCSSHNRVPPTSRPNPPRNSTNPTTCSCHVRQISTMPASLCNANHAHTTSAQTQARTHRRCSFIAKGPERVPRADQRIGLVDVSQARRHVERPKGEGQNLIYATSPYFWTLGGRCRYGAPHRVEHARRPERPNSHRCKHTDGAPSLLPTPLPMSNR